MTKFMSLQKATITNLWFYNRKGLVYLSAILCPTVKIVKWATIQIHPKLIPI